MAFFYPGDEPRALQTPSRPSTTLDSQHPDIMISVYTGQRFNYFTNLISVVRTLKFYSFWPVKIFIINTIF